ncbi:MULTISPECIES: hypothetical protein [unclassified Micromonospora]|uniref:hypothetical protein n=1 Tax=unclassified Micromonospora TaxID=2617518 RepID=UPI0033187C91
MPEDGWTPIANAALRDYRLSWRARGLLAELLSYPDGWDTTVDKLVAAARERGDATEGRAAMRAAVAELATIGYVRYIREADERGHWTTVMSVCDVPQPEPDARRTRNRTVGGPDRRPPESSGDRHVGNPDRRGTETSAGRSITKNTDTKTDTNTEDQRLSDEHSVSLASLAAAEAADDSDAEEQQMRKVYAVIDAMDPDLRRRHLLAVERKRPKIYRECRNEAIRQVERMDPDDLKGEHAAHIIDVLSYKWMAQHYSPNWPRWFKDPLESAFQAQTRGTA